MLTRRAGAIVVSIGLGACLGNQSGNLAAGASGDVSHPAQRGSPLDELRAACGDGAATAAGAIALQRQPYLQQVTTTSAMIGWVAGTPDGQRVDVASIDGERMLSAAAEVDFAAARSADENQVWTRLTDLEPGTTYCYSLADDRDALSEPTAFRTAPGADSSEPVRFMAFGDSGGGGSDQYALLDQMLDFPYELIVHTGDLAYDSGTIAQFDDNVFGVYAELFRNLPFFPAAGNHDYKTMQGAPFRDVFALPGTSDERWYSYDWGRVHFVALDTESDYAAQAAWLEQDLAATALPWKVVYLHRPPYSSGAHGSDLALRNSMAPVFEKHHVQLVLAGHDHDYERIEPQNGVTYVVTGGGGIGTRSVGTSSFTALSDNVIHFLYGEVGVEQLTLHAIDGTGAEFDSVVVPI